MWLFILRRPRSILPGMNDEVRRNTPPDDLRSIVERHARRAVLDCLGYLNGTTNDRIVRDFLDRYGMRLSTQRCAAVLDWLDEAGLLTTRRHEGVRIVTLTQRGEELIERRIVVEGVAARPMGTDDD